jgi:thiopeptide-type bacteriocin biosynthesis protein
MKAVVFLGPTLPVETARQYLDATYLPPVEQGDVLRVLREQPGAIGIIDGHFQGVPSVWHKEILTALADGVYVAGASSMGALRAVELAQFGMVGIGSVFDKFHSRVYTDDDEVAVAHAAADQGYRVLSEAMVNLRDWCDRALRTGAIRFIEAEGLVRIAKGLHFTERKWQRILDQAIAEGMPVNLADRVRAFQMQVTPSAQARDAIALLQHLSALAAEPWSRRQTQPVEQTVLLADLKRQVARESVQDLERAPGTSLNVARKKVLLGVLASREVARRGLIIARDHVAETTDWFRGSYSLAKEDRFIAWKANHALPDSDFDFAMHRFTELAQVEETSGPEIDAELDTYLRVYSAAAQNAHETPTWIQLNVALRRGEGGPQQSARILFRQLLPVLRGLRKRGTEVKFFFVRKPPDIRLRFQAVAADEKLMPCLATLFADLLSSGVVVSAVRSVYEPEARVFGGSEAMDVVHSYFHEDTMEWVAWDQLQSQDRRIPTEQLCTAVMNNLFGQILEGHAEIWDAWQSLAELTRGAKRLGDVLVAGGESLQDLSRVAGLQERRVLKNFAKANRMFAESARKVWESGRLELGLRNLLVRVAMFHCNRFGLDGAKRLAIAERAAAAWNPYREVASRPMRELRSAMCEPARARASRSAESTAAD